MNAHFHEAGVRQAVGSGLGAPLLAGLALVCGGCARAGYSGQGVDAGASDASTPAVYLYFEAESGRLIAPFKVMDDPQASAGKYVLDVGSRGNPSGGEARYELTVAREGSFFLWGRVLATSDMADSFAVAFDGAAEDVYHTAERTWSTAWQWSMMTLGDSGDWPRAPRVYRLTAGLHVLILRSREAESTIDRLLLTDDADFRP